MNRWPFAVESYTPAEVQEFCVRDAEWQQFRKSLKGLPTVEKLIRLRRRHLEPVSTSRRRQVQVDNYINALKRGGQLAMDMTVQR